MGDPLYDQDFYLWSQDQARRLRALKGDNRLDTDNLAEEVADLGRSELNKALSHLRQALVHILKAAAVDDPQLLAGWTAEVLHHLDEAQDSFTPGMRQQIDLDRASGTRLSGRRRPNWPRIGEAGLPAWIACPFTLDELFDPAFEIDAAITRVRAALQADEPGA
ncbi:MAG: DUF29 domain-containing protein [Rhodovibrio sp.]|nr:DUF29 domain-containing protein [Rhodovibrio sp.]